MPGVLSRQRPDIPQIAPCGPGADWGIGCLVRRLRRSPRSCDGEEPGSLRSPGIHGRGPRSWPGDEGKWFATAKEVGLFDEAIRLANRTPCDPKTLTRAARDFAAVRPEFAVEAGLAALHWLVEGYGYEITSADVWAAYTETMKAAERAGRAGEARERIRTLVARETSGDRFVTRTLGRALGL